VQIVTSNLAERFFDTVKDNLTAKRNSLLPKTIERAYQRPESVLKQLVADSQPN